MRTSRGLAEEGEAGGEGLVLVGVRACVGEELLEVFLTVGRQPVDDLGAASVRDSGGLPTFPGSSINQPLATSVLRQG
ncbi:hypothetical protein SVIOM342S_06502 [Streptomyces violaceorubidus]